MTNQEKAKFIDHFLKAIYDASSATSLAMGIELKKMPSKDNVEKFKMLEHLIEKLDLVVLERGRDNSTLNGQCEYWISSMGKGFVEHHVSTIILLDGKHPFDSLWDNKGWDYYFDSKIDKRVEQADFYLDIVISENLLNLDKSAIKNISNSGLKKIKILTYK